MSEEPRIEMRDGKPFVVTTLPEVERKRKPKPLMTKRMARALAVGKNLRAGPATQLAKRRKRKQS